MSSPVQVLFIPIAADCRVHEAGSEDANTWNEKFLSPLRETEGVEEVFWSRQLDNDENIGVVVFWASRPHLQAWQTRFSSSMLQLNPLIKASYKSYTLLLPAFTTVSPATEKQDLHRVLSQNITKLFIWYFPHSTAPPTNELQTTVSLGLGEFVRRNFVVGEVEEKGDGSEQMNAFGAWREEEDEAFGEKGRSFSGFVGLQSEDDFRKMPPFEANFEKRKGMTMRTFEFAKHGLGG
ncbi:hypothetical protein BP5796_07151 [Coleophoma crateriformis]|uniref:ABM domain-containing protein n=1 Tax=Coleophoma crateriformis TaxID=565419 RepID=A0A3D8RI22_9HELO|nr:hypothetical protein BP5796_07151 [Coleophoma crateriformis]